MALEQLANPDHRRSLLAEESARPHLFQLVHGLRLQFRRSRSEAEVREPRTGDQRGHDLCPGYFL